MKDKSAGTTTLKIAAHKVVEVLQLTTVLSSLHMRRH